MTATPDELRNASPDDLAAYVQQELECFPLTYDPANVWTDAWQLLHDGLLRWGNASVSWDMEDYGREPGDICWVEIGNCRTFGEFRHAVCQAWLFMRWMEQQAPATTPTKD